MRSVFDKARAYASSFLEDFTYTDIFSDARTKKAITYMELSKQLTNLMNELIGTYGARSIQVACMPVHYERYQYRFMPGKKTDEAEYLSVGRFWAHLNKLRREGDDGILVVSDENNLPLLSCDCCALRDALRQLCDNHGLTKYYKNYFDAINALQERAMMGETPRLN